MSKKEIEWNYYYKDGSGFKVERFNSEKKDDGREISKTKLKPVIECFNNKIDEIYSNYSKNKKLYSNTVLSELTENLKKNGYKVEEKNDNNKKRTIKLLEIRNKELNMKSENINLFQVDAFAFKEKKGILIEIESGRAYANNQFLKDFYEAIVSDIVNYLVIAVRRIYITKNKENKEKNHYNFKSICRYLDVLTESKNSKNLPLEGILIIGY